MRRLLSVVGLVIAACGSVDEKPTCSVSTDCPVGQYCATSGGERRCWADTVAPTVGTVTVSCGTTPCLRDGVLRVEATATDDHEVLDAAVSLDLDATRSFPMTRSGGAWVADVPLRALPFDFFSHDVTATVIARDGARTPSAPRAAGSGVAVTRFRWSRAIDGNATLSATPPAVMADGSVVVGGTNGKVYFVAPDGTDAHAALTVGAGLITAAPAVGQHAIWVGSEDGTLYGVELDGSAVLANVGVNLGGPIKGSVAVKTGAVDDVAFATCKKLDNTGWIGAASSTASRLHFLPAADGFSSGPVIGTDERVHAATATLPNDATLRTFTLGDSPWGLTPSWTAPVGKGSSAPVAVDSAGALVAPSDESPAQLKRTVPGTTPLTTVVGDLSVPALDSAIVLANGDNIVGDESGRVHRFAATGPVWSPAPALGSGVRGLLATTHANSPLIVPTNNGKVFALRDDGTTLWETTLPSATQLRAGNIHTPGAGPAGQVVVSYAYFSSGNGYLYSIIVDGQLDGGAPWPKAFHDPRNTNHAGPQP